MAQVSLGEILRCQDAGAYSCINSKRVDLLLMDDNCQPRHAIEYHGDGHYQAAAAARDAVKKEAYFTCPALLLVPSVPLPTFRVRGYHPLWPPFPERSAKSKAKRYRLLRFRSPLLSESRLISVPAVTEMFQFSAFALPSL